MKEGIAHEFTARVAGVYVGGKQGTLETQLVEKAYATWNGFMGDSHAGRTRFADAREYKKIFPRDCEILNLRQWSGVSLEQLRVLTGKLTGQRGTLLAEWLGANLLFEGIQDFSALPAGTQLVFDPWAVLVVTAENGPCVNPGKLIQQHLPDFPGIAANFVKEAMGLRGVVGLVKRPGVIRMGSDVTVLVPKQRIWPYNGEVL